MTIGSILNGIVLDHIPAGKGMEIYKFLDLDRLECSVAIIKNAQSGKLGKKDIIKIDTMIGVDLNILGFFSPDITVNIIKNGELSEKYHPLLPETVRDVIKCKNPRCITSTEQDLPHIFKLTDAEEKTYRCIYCETMAEL